MMVRPWTVRRTEKSALRQIRVKPEPDLMLRLIAGDSTIHHPALPTQDLLKEPNPSRVDAL